MLELLKKRINNEKGLSLVELLAVIVILGIVAAIAVPAIGNIIENSRYNAVKADAVNIINAANLYYTDAPDDAGDTVTVKQLIENDFLDARGKIPETATVTRATPRALGSASDIVYSGSKTVDLTGATIDGINEDKSKGSDSGNRSISK